VKDDDQASDVHDDEDNDDERDVADVINDVIHMIVRSVNVYDVKFAVEID